MSLTIRVHGMHLICDVQYGGGAGCSDGWLVVVVFLALAGFKVLSKEHLGINIPKPFWFHMLKFKDAVVSYIKSKLTTVQSCNFARFIHSVAPVE